MSDRVSSLRSHSLGQNSKVASVSHSVSQSLSESLTKVMYRAARAAKNNLLKMLTFAKFWQFLSTSINLSHVWQFLSTFGNFPNICQFLADFENLPTFGSFCQLLTCHLAILSSYRVILPYIMMDATMSLSHWVTQSLLKNTTLELSRTITGYLILINVLIQMCQVQNTQYVKSWNNLVQSESDALALCSLLHCTT